MANYLQEWEISHRRGILKEIKDAGIEFILEKLEEIVREASFASRTGKFPTFDYCPYIKKKEPCHPNVEDLNCFLCACPNYDSEKDDGGCNINSKNGKIQYHESLPLGKVWDCSDCQVNHTPGEVKRYITRNFEEIKKVYDSL